MNTLPPTLVRFEFRLADAIRRQRRGRPRRLALRVATVGVAATAAGLGIVSVLPGGGTTTAVARAADALEPAEGTILHTVVVSTVTRPDGSVTTDRTETWRQESPPYDERIVSGGGGREHALADGRPLVYIPRTNTIHMVAPGTELPPLGSEIDHGQRLLRVMRGLLASGEAREDGRVSAAGGEAIRIVATTARVTMLVDAETYEPLEWTTVSDDGIRVRDRFVTYERLPATAANLALLSLTGRHPDAKIVYDGRVEGFDGPKGS